MKYVLVITPIEIQPGSHNPTSVHDAFQAIHSLLEPFNRYRAVDDEQAEAECKCIDVNRQFEAHQTAESKYGEFNVLRTQFVDHLGRQPTEDDDKSWNKFTLPFRRYRDEMAKKLLTVAPNPECTMCSGTGNILVPKSWVIGKFATYHFNNLIEQPVSISTHNFLSLENRETVGQALCKAMDLKWGDLMPDHLNAIVYPDGTWEDLIAGDNPMSKAMVYSKHIVALVSCD